MKFDLAAFKHGKKQEDIEFVYGSQLTQWFSNGVSIRGNERAILIGFDLKGNLTEVALELIVDEFGNDEEYFYHAMTATTHWQKQYAEKRQYRKS
jgi:hypothetical protein